MEQGVVARGQFKPYFWRNHYFDWLLFGKRAIIFGGIGGFALGAAVFGNSTLAIERMALWYTQNVKKQPLDIHATSGKFVN